MNEEQMSLKIKSIILHEFSNNIRDGLYAATQKIMAYNSNKIEGSTLTSEQTASLFDTGTITSYGIETYKAKDIEEMNGHFKMFYQMLKTLDEPLTINMIKGYHYQLKNGVFEDLANGYPIGEFKNRANIVSDIKTASPKSVEEELTGLLEEFNKTTISLESIAVFHAKYEKIHPFQDGNGRTGRMIIFKQCINNGIIPAIIKEQDKYIYYQALHKAQTEDDYSLLLEFLKKSQKEYLEYIVQFLED